MKGAIVALVLGWASVALAQEAKPNEPIDAAIAEARYGDAYKLAGEAVSAHGDDPAVRYSAAVACLRTARFAEAAQHITAGLANHADADLLGLRAEILLSAGDEAGARAAVDQALALVPDAPDALTAANELALGETARARLAGTDPGLPAGSPQAFVDQTIAAIAGGASPGKLAEAFDLEILSSVDPENRTRATLVASIDGALEEARKMRDGNGQQFFGWLTATEATPSGDRVIVDVQVPIESTITKTQRDAIAMASSDPQLRGTVDAMIIAMIDGVPADERDALLDRLMGLHTRTVLDLHFEVAGTGDDQRITDLVIGSVSVKAQLGNFSKLHDKVSPPRSRFHLSPQAIGTVVGFVVGIIVLVFLLTRRRR